MVPTVILYFLPTGEDNIRINLYYSIYYIKYFLNVYIFFYCYLQSISTWILLKSIETVKEDFEMFSKDKDKNAKKIIASEKEDEQIHIPDLDDGESAFMEWLNSEDKISSKNHMILKKFQNDKECILHDNTLKLDVIVTINDGVPFCLSCQDDSCAHVGFTVCVMQLFERKGILIGENESILDLFKD